VNVISRKSHLKIETYEKLGEQVEIILKASQVMKKSLNDLLSKWY
jgi:hypothetical protein